MKKKITFHSSIFRSKDKKKTVFSIKTVVMKRIFLFQFFVYLIRLYIVFNEF